MHFFHIFMVSHSIVDVAEKKEVLLSVYCLFWKGEYEGRIMCHAGCNKKITVKYEIPIAIKGLGRSRKLDS